VPFPRLVQREALGGNTPSTGRTLLTAEIAAANVPLARGFEVMLVVSVFTNARIPLLRADHAVARNAQSQSCDALGFLYRRSNRNAMPTPMSTNEQTKTLWTFVSVRSDSRNTRAAIKNSGPVIAQ
jgi:hypothetical protein